MPVVCLLPFAFYLLPFAFYLLPFTFYLLPFAFCLLPFAFHLLPCFWWGSLRSTPPYALPPTTHCSHATHSEKLPPPHRPLRPPQCGQVVAVERADAARGLDRLGRGRHDHRSGGKAHGNAATGTGRSSSTPRASTMRGPWANSASPKPSRSSSAPTWAWSWSMRVSGARSRRPFSTNCSRETCRPSWSSTSPTSASRDATLQAELQASGVSNVVDRGVGGPRCAGTARGPDPRRPGRLPASAGDRRRPGAARRNGDTRGAHRHGGPQGPAHRAASANDPRLAGRRRLLHGRQRARTARCLGAAQTSAGAGGHRFAGLPQGGRRHAAGHQDDLVFHPLRAAEGRLEPVRAWGDGDRHACGPATACSWPSPAAIIPSATTSGG